MSSAWFIWAVLLLQAAGAAASAIERNPAAALLMVAGVLVQVATLMVRGQPA